MTTRREAAPRAKPPIPAPTETDLRESAYASLARRAASVAQLRTTLQRKITTWATRSRRAGRDAVEIEAAIQEAREASERVLRGLIERGLLDDAKFAETRAQGLSQRGKSRRAIEAHLAAKGVASEITREHVVIDAASELEAAVRLARKRRIGPFVHDPAAVTPELRHKALGVLARAGFDRSTCERVLRLERDAAEALLGSRGW